MYRVRPHVMVQGCSLMPSMVIRSLGSTVSMPSSIATLISHQHFAIKKTSGHTLRLASYPCPRVVMKQLSCQIRRKLWTILRRLVPRRIYAISLFHHFLTHCPQEGYTIPLPYPRCPPVPQHIPILAVHQATLRQFQHNQE